MEALIPRETKLLRLLLDESAQPGEITVGLTKLRESLAARGISWSNFVDTVINAGLAEKDASEAALPPESSKPDYGMCRVPFGKNRGALFMDVPPYELRNIRRWCLSKPDLATKFADLISDTESFLGPGACR